MAPRKNELDGHGNAHRGTKSATKAANTARTTPRGTTEAKAKRVPSKQAARTAIRVAAPANVATGATARTTGQGAASGSAVSPRTRGRSGSPSVITVNAAADQVFTPAGPVDRVVTALGNNVVADVLGVSTSQPSRWRSGAEQITAGNRKRISDLDHILDRLLLELYPDQAGLWLSSPNPHLYGARPIDVLVLRGAAPVLDAIDALAAGAFV